MNNQPQQYPWDKPEMRQVLEALNAIVLSMDK